MLDKGTVKMRYPGNDPENGPAYKQTWDGEKWTCAEHKYRQQVFGFCKEDDAGHGGVCVGFFCKFCGKPPVQ